MLEDITQKNSYDKTCKCFICNSPDHLSRTCPNKDQKRYSSKYEEQERVLIIDSCRRGEQTDA